MMELEVELRRKNQLTWPEPLARAMGVSEGARLKIVYEEATGEARVRPIREGYAGALRGTYGASEEEIRAYLMAERRSWGE